MKISSSSTLKKNGFTIIKTVILLAVIIPVLMGGVYGIRKETSNKDSSLKIGVVLPLTGPASFIGNSVKNGIEVGQSLYGPDVSIEIAYQDSMGDPSRAVSAYHGIRATGKGNIIISVGSAVANAILPLTEKDDILHVATAVAAAGFPEKGKHCFRLFLSADVEAKLTAQYCFNKLNSRRAAILYINDDFGKSYLEYFTKEFEKDGRKVVISEGVGRTQCNFRDTITKVKSKDFDVIYLVSNNDFQGNFIKQIRECGISTPIVTLLTILKEENIKGAGHAIKDVYYAASDFNPEALDGPQKEFIDEYKKRFGTQVPDAYAAFSADIIHFICNAVKDGNGDTYSIENHMNNNPIDGIMGKIKFHSRDSTFGIVVKPVLSEQSVKSSR